ncbi:hypothetical protein T12_1645 [Trichinella patagoniensis]|uniref:Uncharacterized protein n=1 Tax=Trichinella patagoniensis TaxID=990121 RepID=A0A0V0ZP70_9BILA|nr:hypothetical protein T12_1645 [Trichinella patagoniensis]
MLKAYIARLLGGVGTILNVIEFVFNYETPKNGATLLIQINTTLLAKDTCPDLLLVSILIFDCIPTC